MTLDESMKKLHSLHNESNIFDWCHIIPNEKIVVLSLLHSGGDFTRAIGNCVHFGFDTDSNAAVVGAVMGTLLGPEGIEEKWTVPICGLLASAVLDEHMNRIDELAERTFKVAKREIVPDSRMKQYFEYSDMFSVD